MSFIIQCLYCNKSVSAQRKTKKFCSVVCEQRYLRNFPKERSCRHCGKMFPIVTRSDANRQHCSKACAKSHNAKRIKEWHDDNPEKMNQYNANRVSKKPTVWQEQRRKDRLTIIELLGGKCVVCGVNNPNWLHVDYIPTTRDQPYRHPRHLKYIREHLELFRLLCANHHYELTLTRKIDGTDITQ